MKKNVLEWIVFAISLVLIAGVLGYLTRAAIRGPSGPPELRIVTGQPEPVRDQWRIPLIIRNDGEETAEAVRVEVTLRCAAEQPERAELDFAFVPRHSQREGAVLFRTDPRPCQIAAQAVAYEQP